MAVQPDEEAKLAALLASRRLARRRRFACPRLLARARRGRRGLALGRLARHFRALRPRLTESDGDRLLAAGDCAARAALERALLLTVHRRLHRLRCLLSILGHETSLQSCAIQATVRVERSRPCLTVARAA